MNDEYVTGSTAREMLKITAETLRSWDKKGKIGAIKTPSGQRRYNLKDINDILGIAPSFKQKRKICYCRVSSKKQMDDLERQKDFFRQEYPNHELVTDIGSGINWKRKGLKTILEQSMLGNIEELVVAHRDRLCRFPFELIQFIFETNNVKLMVLDTTTGESGNSELADDILSIIHIYSCRSMGKRRYKSKKDKDLPESESEEDTEEMDRGK
jgi:predicted site-specific integrase-resolvase